MTTKMMTMLAMIMMHMRLLISMMRMLTMKTMTAPDYTDHHRQEALEEEERRMAMER